MVLVLVAFAIVALIVPALTPSSAAACSTSQPSRPQPPPC